MGRRTVLLIAALVVAALGTAMVFIYVNNADNRAQADASLVKVLVAAEDVEPGTTAGDATAAGAFVEKEVTNSSLAPGAISDTAVISDQVALAPIFAGQQIQAQMFGEPRAQSVLNVPKDQLGVSVELGDPNRVAGFVVPGSHVAVFATFQPDQGVPFTGLLLPDAEVIGVGDTTVTTQTTTDEDGDTTTEEIPSAILTLALSSKESEKLVFAAEQGSLYFALQPEDSTTKPSGPTNSKNLFDR